MVALALERAPRAALPMRFFAAVPVWGLIGALLLWQAGPAALAGRWAPATLALAHVWVLGVLGNAMLGSLLQFLPVVAGADLRRLEPLAPALHAVFNIGLALLLAGWLVDPRAHGAAALLLGAALLPFFALCLHGLWRAPRRADGLRPALVAALAAGLATVLLGALLALGRAGVTGVAQPGWTDAHAALGLLGWVLGLLAAVGAVVLPMFQGAAPWPLRARRLGGTLGAGLLLVAVAGRASGALDPSTAGQIMALPLAGFALAVLWAQRRGRHRRNGALRGVWRLSALALLVTAVLLALRPALPAPAVGVLIGALGIVVAAQGFVLGMLLEIVAFIGWIALQRQRPAGLRRHLPGVEALLGEADKRRLLGLHGLGAVALPLAIVWPVGAVACVAAALQGLLHAALAVALLRARQRRIAIAREFLPPPVAMP